MRERIEGSFQHPWRDQTYDYVVEYRVIVRRLRWASIVRSQERTWAFSGWVELADRLEPDLAEEVTRAVQHEISLI